MSKKTQWVRRLLLASAGTAALTAMTGQWTGEAPQVAKAQTVAPSPTRSSPIAITSDNRFVWSVNPDNNSVSVFNVASGVNQKVAEIPVGTEPWGVAITPDNAKVYVTNMVSGTVSVVDGSTWQVIKTIQVGTEPFGCALTPDGERLYVANQSSADVSVINTKNDHVVRTIENVGAKPHGVAITADGNKVYVTQFLALRPANDPRPLTQSEGADNGREGRVTVIDTQTNSVIKTVVLNPLANVGNAFLSIGNTLLRRPLLQQAGQPQPGQPAVPEISGAFPNLLESVVIRGNIAYIPNTCSSPNGPFRFNVNVQSCLSSVDTVQDVEAFPTVNMNVGVNFEPVGKKLFNTNPFAGAFKRSSPEGFVALAATDRLVRVTLNAQGLPTINPPANAGDSGNIIRIELKDPVEILQPDPNDTIGGKNPRGVVLNSTDTRAYVMDFVSRDVAVVDISGADPTQYKTLVRMQSAEPPAAGSQAAIVQRGKQLFNSAIGPEGALDNSKRPAGRLSDTGWGSCYSCHPQGLTDTVTWMFADGPRQAISMENTFEFGAAVIQNGAPALPASHQRALNWSAIRDETQDFTRNVRAVSGGGGLILGIAEGAAGLGAVPDLVPVANSFRSGDLDAIATYLALGVRAPISPGGSSKGKKLGHVKQGRELFEAAGCQNCHGGRSWTVSVLDFTPPPAATEIVDGQLVRFLCRVGTFDANLFTDGVSNEIRSNNNANVQARGILGFSVPSLISVFSSAPYLHSGAAPTLEAVLENVTHRSIGRPDGQDVLTKPEDRAKLVEFLKSIDRSTEPFLNVNPPLGACGAQP
jgi:YVTN family beta-propeller protein